MFRDINDKDLALILKDIATDPAHNQQPGFHPALFIDENAKNVAIQDENGEVIFWVSFLKEVRVRIQFREGVDKEKVREAFRQNIPIFAEAYSRAGAKAFLFDSVSAPLVWFLRRFGFRKATSEYRKEF